MIYTITAKQRKQLMAALYDDDDGMKAYKLLQSLDEVQGITAFAKSIIAARDKQWSEMLGEPVAWQWVDVDGLTKTIRMNPHIEHATPLYAPKQEKP